MSSNDLEVKRLKRVFGVVYFAQGMNGLPQLSIFYYMMNILKLGPVAGQFFQGLNHLAWYIKPLWGFISDRVPILGYRRKSYFGVMAVLALFSWLGIALLTYLQWTWVLPYIILINVAQLSYAFVDVVVDALMVEHGQKLKLVGSFVNFQWLMLSLASVFVAVTSGWFQEKVEQNILPYWIVFASTACFPLFTAIIGMTNLDEERIRKTKPFLKRGVKSFKNHLFQWPNRFHSMTQAFKNFRQKERHLLFLILFIVAWNFSPSISYAGKTYMAKELHFTPTIFGILNAVSSLVWLLSIFVYRWFARHFSRVRWDQYLYGMVVIAVISLLSGYYFYLPVDHPLSLTIPFSWEKILSWGSQFKGSSIGALFYKFLEGASNWNRYHWWALFTDTTLGFASIPAFLIPLTLAGEAASRSNAGFTYALLMSVSNFTHALEDITGGALYQLLSASWMQGFMRFFEYSSLNISRSHNSMVLILQIFVYMSAFFTIIATPFIWLTRREFLRKGIQVHL
ncbi:MAG: PucC family protein [Chlamydiae bacterium]|nr:PucC family protein [Chlamydiota bacterium]MBI3277627.1 PucC family protein [Chlamydiota bacterium]